MCKFCGFNDVFNNLDDYFKWEKSGWNNNWYDFYGELPPPVFSVGASADTSAQVFNLYPTGVD